MLGIGCVALSLASSFADDQGLERTVDGQFRMGTVLEIEVRGLDPESARMLLGELFAEVAAQERILSSFDPETALSRLNAKAGAGMQPVPDALAELLREAKELGALTGGTFDVTVGPLVELWREAGRTGVLPSAESLRKARERVGLDRIGVELSPPGVDLDTGTVIELGGIAKGFALDRLLPRVVQSGATSALLNFGQSSVHGIGAPEGQQGWRILLRDPDIGAAGVITLRDQALSVSVSTGQSVEIEGKRYGHLLDPRTGVPVSEAALAAVVAPSGTRAEALSKALLLLDEDGATALLARLPDCAAMRLHADGRRWYSERWVSGTQFEEAIR